MTRRIASCSRGQTEHRRPRHIDNVLYLFNSRRPCEARRNDPLVLLIGFASAWLLLWAIFIDYTVSAALKDAYPEEFQDGAMWKIAFPIFVLSPLTPLDLQRRCLQSWTGISFAGLGFSSCCFLYGNVVAGWIILIMSIASAVVLVGYWRTHLMNCRRKAADNGQEEL